MSTRSLFANPATEDTSDSSIARILDSTQLVIRPWAEFVDRASGGWWYAGLEVDGVEVAGTSAMGGPFEAGSALIRMIRSWRFDLSRSVNWNETLFKELAMKKVGKKVTKKVGGGKPAPPVTKSAPTVESGDLGPAQTGTGDEVNVQVGKTINLGNYETLRVDVGARVRVNSGETFNDAFNRAREMVLQRTQEMIAEVKSTFSE